MSNIYTNGEYLEATRSWHAEDSPWKAEQIYAIIKRNDIRAERIVEVGCGAGGVLCELSQKPLFAHARLQGFDISPHAIELARQKDQDKVQYHCGDIFSIGTADADMLLAIDVFEHVPDYMGFLSKCRSFATFKIYHIPLDIHASAVLRETFISTRYGVGHLHFFTEATALATLRDTGHEIVDHCLTNGAMGLFRQHPSVKRALANVPRWLMSQASPSLTARILGGYSLLALTR